MNEPYCVYAHKVQERIVYIGSGRIHRATCFDPRRRNRIWLKATEGERIGVVIIGRFESKRTAFAHERKLIFRLRPVANIKDNFDYPQGYAWKHVPKSERP